MSSPIVIKKYANRRLYNTETSTYVTHEDLCQLISENVPFLVQDVKTGQDLTRMLLIQIIFDLESKGYNMLPVNFLRRIISLYGNDLMRVIPPYLEIMMENFFTHKTEIKDFFDQTFVGYSPVSQMETLHGQNIKLWKQIMGMFSPFQES